MSLPPSPEKTPQNLDINSNQNEKERNKEKDFQDRRKSEDDAEDNEVNSSFSDIYGKLIFYTIMKKVCLNAYVT